MVAPFSTVFQSQDNLPSIFKEQYLLPYDAPYYLEFKGQMHRIWHTKKWLWPFFWLLAQFDIIFPESGENVPTKVVIHSGRDKYGRPFHDWQRIYQFPNKTRHSNARLVYDENHQSPVELFKPKGMVQVCWDAQFKSPGTILIETTNYVLKVGNLSLSLPQWMRGQVTAVETIDFHHPDRIHLSFELSYPRLGSVFGYEGTFDCVKRPYRQSHDEIKFPL